MPISHRRRTPANTCAPAATADTAAGPIAGGGPRGGCTRRVCLRALTAPLLVLPTGFTTAAVPAGAGRLWMLLFAGRDGGPVYWLSRGTEYVVVDGAATPVKGRVSVIAAVSRPREGGTTRVAYLLQGCNLAAGSLDLAPRLVHPITGDEIPTAVTAPLRLGWNFAADGQVTEDLVAANGTKVAYRGEAWEAPGVGEERTASLRMNIRLVRPNGEVENFSEFSSSRARSTAVGTSQARRPAPADGFIGADSETFTVRELNDKAKYKGATTVLSTSMSHAANFASVDELRRALRPGEVSALTGFFEQQAAWVRET